MIRFALLIAVTVPAYTQEAEAGFEIRKRRTSPARG